MVKPLSTGCVNMHCGCMLSTVISDYISRSGSFELKIDPSADQKKETLPMWFCGFIWVQWALAQHALCTFTVPVAWHACALHVPLICPRTMLQVSGYKYILRLQSSKNL